MWDNKFCLEALRSRQTNPTKTKNRESLGKALDECPTCMLIVIVARDKCRRIIYEKYSQKKCILNDETFNEF